MVSVDSVFNAVSAGNVLGDAILSSVASGAWFSVSFHA